MLFTALGLVGCGEDQQQRSEYASGARELIRTMEDCAQWLEQKRPPYRDGIGIDTKDTETFGNSELITIRREVENFQAKWSSSALEKKYQLGDELTSCVSQLEERNQRRNGAIPWSFDHAKPKPPNLPDEFDDSLARIKQQIEATFEGKI